MDIPLKLKWLGKETAELCKLLAPFHPLILISSAPHLRNSDLPAGLVRLPNKICRVLDLRYRDFAYASDDDLAFDVLELSDNAQNFSALYEFYCEVYLRNSALKHVRRISDYRYLEPFHSNLLERRFIALIRGVYEDRTVAGLLLRHSTAVELDAYRARLGASVGEAEVAIVDVLSLDEGSKHWRSLVQRASEWAREAGYSFLSSLPTSALITNENEFEDDWTLENETTTVGQEANSALLYCDLRRCSYFSNDIYYYSLSGNEVSLHYVANVSPHHSGIVRLLNSTIGIEKKVYTRHASVREALSAAGIECEFLNSANILSRAKLTERIEMGHG
jgi:hypothetical protein